MPRIVFSFLVSPCSCNIEGFFKNRLPATIVSLARAIWEFARPHTIVGTSVTAVGIYVIAMNGLNSAVIQHLGGFFFALTAGLLTNLFIVGINQIFDIEIDKVNKPYLPLAAGTLSMSIAWILVIFAALGSLAMAWYASVPLGVTITLGLLIGAAYSLPPLRLKNHGVWASLSIVTVRGAINNIGVFMHFRIVAGYDETLTGPIYFLIVFITVLSSVIAVFKDIPDMSGDKQFNVMTIPIRIGRNRVFQVSLISLILNYVLTGASCFIFDLQMNPLIIGATHILLAAWLFFKARGLDLANSDAVFSFYMDIWKLFYLEYLIVPLALPISF